MLKEVFISLVSKYSQDKEYIDSLWNEVVKNHGKKNRHYHNLSHLENLYSNLLAVKKEILDWDIVLFALFYHDYIYNALKQDNEERSAQKAIKIFSSLSIDPDRIELCKKMILATKGHQVSKSNDINYFTDADLSILGSSWTVYETYYKNVKKEYKYYPDFMYNKGRVNVLKHFINMPRIFKTDYFYSKFEKQAKNNLQQEIGLLS
ncbi:HD domain-containing protein [Aquimarina rubra]|uniref:Metal-dependent HD superfamily phosphohydrolase n=1 Tax=Aquimarina rubra TaxID=1920033 RepID=A0ABW5LG31_9FLAO